MLYVFHVDIGTTITFDIKLALQDVSQLKEAIERECGVLAAHQVLLMNGGESLEPNARVCSYSAGTDTNPIYLFSKAAIESEEPPAPCLNYGTDVDLQQQIDTLLAMPPTYGTLVSRAQLAQQCNTLSREQHKICERLVHDQHLQQQGWSAVVANLEDITQVFLIRVDLLEQSFSAYLAEREQHMELLRNFNKDLGTLAKIPILPALRAHAEGTLSPDEETCESTEEKSEGGNKVLSLLRWISAKDNQSSLEQVAEQCSRGLEQFDERVIEALKAEVSSAVDAANRQEMKDIKGLGDRLYALEQLLIQVRKVVQEQGELAQSFLQNQNRANNLGDASVLPDLSHSHRRQLLVMHNNHNQIRDIRRRCMKAKEELSVNIYYRLKWIMYVENKMMEVDGKLVMYHESLKRLRRHLEVLQQIHLAPQMYMSAVAEVVRRRTFSQAFLVWASNLACQLLTVHTEELARRREFQSKFDGHFLSTLFPGLEDSPPPFATQAPSVFDTGLPKLTADDMEALKSQLPDLAVTISVPDLNSITQFFLSKSLTEGSIDGNKEKEVTSMRGDNTSKDQEHVRAPTLNDRGGFESETDTEEFEKIGQGGGDSKPSSFEVCQQHQKHQKQTEVGGSRSVSPVSSSSVSPQSSKVSSEPGSFHFPSLSTSERPLESHSHLSPLEECAENGDSSGFLLRRDPTISTISTSATNITSAATDNRSASKYRDASPSSLDEPNSPSPNPISSTRSAMCDVQRSQQQQQQHQQQQQQFSGSGGSSPSVGVGATDFLGTEFYMDESLPSSLSEHPVDGQHQAIVSLLQENLGNTREEVERLRSILKTMKAVMSEALASFREEIEQLRERSKIEKSNLSEMTERVREALSLYSRECDRRLQEREQELTVDHELEMADVKKLMQNREEEIRSIKSSLLEKETELAEHERLISTMRQKLEEEQTEMRNIRTCIHQQLEDALDQARVDKETAVKKVNDDRYIEIASLTSSLTQCHERIQKLEDELAIAETDQRRAVKDATDQLQMQYKTELDNIRGRYKLMAASNMERTPSDSSLEKIERPDVIELANHEAILAQAKEDMKLEKSEAVRVAIEKERTDCIAKLDQELRLARQVVEEKDRLVEEKERLVDRYRMRELALTEECKRYRNTIRRLTKSENVGRQAASDKGENLELEKSWLEAKQDRKNLDQKDNLVLVIQSALRKEKVDERAEMSQGLEEALKALEPEKDEVEVSESKKVRLETDDDPTCLTRRLEILENDNKRLNGELQSIRESKEAAEAKVEALEADKVRLEVELVKERSRRGFGTDSSSSTEGRDKDMNASVAVVSDSSSRDVATSPEPSRHLSSSSCVHSSCHLRKRMTKSAAKLVQQGRITITTCNPGDIVLILWDPAHDNYMLFQESTTLYFLNSDCNAALNLGFNPDSTPKCLQTIAEVIDKEYCHAKKTHNRYRVPLGTKFYRVRVKPVEEALMRSILLAKSQHQ